jgi:peptide/nickel transport system ATP-binding protein
MTIAVPLLEVQGLSRTFDVSPPWLERVIAREPRRLLRAVDDVSFTVRRGTTFALVGESGSGKSTVARMITGLLAPTAGRALLDGSDLTRLDDNSSGRAIRRRLAMIFQDPSASLDPRMTTATIVAEPIRAFSPGLPRQEVSGRVTDLLVQVGLSPRDGGKYPHELSGGQRQRIAIARALAGSPDFVVCDEPTSALDVSVQAQILNLMRDLQDRLGLTYLLISHNLAVVRHMAADVGVMYLGRLTEVAPARELFARPRHPYTRMLLEAVPDLRFTDRERLPPPGEIASPLDPPAGCAFHPRCPLAVGVCRQLRPDLRQLGDAEAACHVLSA